MQKANRRGRRPRPSTAMITHPPPLGSYAIRHTTRLRFISNAAFAGNVTYENLCDTMLIAATAIQGWNIFAAVKVRAVEVWALPVLGNASTVSVIFSSQTTGFVGDQKLHTDTSMGIEPAHVRAVPNKRSLASEFQVAGVGQTAFNLTCPAGAVVDVECAFQQSSTLVVTQAQNALVGATIGGSYWRGLDGLAIATTKFTPVAPQTI
jgi:hypothetical protein